VGDDVTFSGLEILSAVIILIIILFLPFFVNNGWFGIFTKIIATIVVSIIVAIVLYVTYQYYSLEDVPLDKIEAQNILDKQKIIYEKKSYDELLKLMYSRGNQPDTFEIIGESNTSYQIEVNSYWEDEDKTNGNLLVYFSIDNGNRSAMSPMSDSFTKKKTP
jgi:hypothetical protein